MTQQNNSSDSSSSQDSSNHSELNETNSAADKPSPQQSATPMTTSSSVRSSEAGDAMGDGDSGNSRVEKKKQKKKTKPKGPIRFEAIIPFFIFTTLVWAYFFFFFDSHLRRSIEYFGTELNGAEVNVAKVNTSFWDASLSIEQIQVTDSERPAKNKIQIGQIRWKMLWDALLRGKIAIEDASILEIAIGAPRARPGRVLPPPPPETTSAFDKVRAQALKTAQEEFSKNVLGDLAAILSGVDPSEQLKTIEGQLKSSLRVKELQTELVKKEQEWKNRIEALPQKKDLESFEKRLKAVKLDGFSSPQELQNSLSQLESIFKDADASYKAIQSAGGALNSDLATYQNTLKELEAMVRQDIKDLEERIKLPKLDVQTLSRSIFGPFFLNKVREAESYMAKARKYMPPEKTPEEKAQYAPPTPRERVEGRNYKFGVPNSYPKFWLKNAAISSKAIKGADWSGDLKGTLRDVTDDPPVLGRPTVARFEGDFPGRGIRGVLGEITIDHRTSEPVERAQLQVASFPVAGLWLIDSNDVKLGFDAASGSSELRVELRGGAADIQAQNVFSKSGAGSKLESVKSFLLAEAKQPILDQVLKGAVAEIPKVTLNASVSGNWSDLRFNINSNLGDDLAQALERQVQLKINEARAKLTAFVEEQVGKEKAKLEAEFAKFRSQGESLIKQKQLEVDKAKSQIEQAKNDAVNSQKKNLEREAQKAIEQLKNKFKF